MNREEIEEKIGKGYFLIKAWVYKVDDNVVFFENQNLVPPEDVVGFIEF